MARIVDRLRQQADQRFVGRQAELSLVRQALADEARSTAVFVVHGPGGVGKTSLLERIRSLATEFGMDAVRLDGRHVEPTASSLLAALAAALGLSADQALLPTVLERWHQQPRRLLLIDTFEHLAPLEPWLRDKLLAELPQQTLVVLAGRHAPSAAWLADPVWRTGVAMLGLRNLAPEECERLLAARGIAAELHDTAQRLTYGHPLAMTLLADVILSSGAVPGQLGTDLIRQLTDCFAAQAPSDAHRQALEICAMARSTTQELLAQLVDAARSHELFEWLASLSFVEAGPWGLFPHDLVRDAVVAELKWRHPQRHQQHAGSLRDHHVQALRSAQGALRSRLALDILFLQRNSALMRRFVDFGGIGTVVFERARDDEIEAIAALVRAELGPQGEALARRWHRHPAARYWVVRDGEAGIVGLTLILTLNALSDADITADPGMGPAWRWIVEHAPARPTDLMMCARLSVAAGSMDKPSPITNALQMCMVSLWLTEPRLAVFLITVAPPHYWEPMMSYIDFHRMDVPIVEMDGQSFAHFMHDWRAMPADRWMELMTQRTQDAGSPAQQAGVDDEPVVMLSQDAFEQAVREALRSLGDAAALAANPLSRSRLVRLARIQDEPAAATLRRLLEEAAQELNQQARDQKFHRALSLTYFRPAGSQERAAERLGLPFGTYRYQLSTGVARLTQQLWRRETDPQVGTADPRAAARAQL